MKTELRITGMHCKSCESILTKSLKDLDGVEHVSVNYESSKAVISYDAKKTNLKEIIACIEARGYGASSQSDGSNAWAYGLAIVGLLVGIYFVLQLVETIQLPQLSAGMSYGLLFIVGLLTGFHCVAMCGGFVVSYTAKNAKEGKSNHLSHVAYGSGKLISYTIIGAAFGLLGSIITFTPLMRGIAGVIAGIFLVIFGLNMLDFVPIFRNIRLSMPKSLSVFIGGNKNSTPFITGLLNGLMIACGPLQAIYIMAAGTGSMIEGAKLLFVFGLGTLPVMLGFGYLASIISSKFTQKILKLSGIIIIILGIIMINRGLSLTGTGYDVTSLVQNTQLDNSNILTNNNVAIKQDNNQEYQEVRMDVLSSGWSPAQFVIKKGVPVKWVINVKELTGCNNEILVPKYNIDVKLKEGLQTIEFTPAEDGVVPFSCWMGMIRGQFIVKSDIDVTDTVAIQKELNNAPIQKSGGSCKMGCGCGG